MGRILSIMHGLDIWKIVSVHYVFKVGGTVGLILGHLRMNWDYSMEFRFYEMKAWREVSDCCGETCFRKLILKKDKQYCFIQVAWWKTAVLSCSAQLVQRTVLPVTFTFWRGVGTRKWVCAHTCLFLNGEWGGDGNAFYSKLLLLVNVSFTGFV